jgi:hypothetical protein
MADDRETAWEAWKEAWDKEAPPPDSLTEIARVAFFAGWDAALEHKQERGHHRHH